MNFNFVNCKGCEQRREAMAAWIKGWQEWAKDPVKNPRPGSKEWLEKHNVAESPDSTR